MSNLRDEEIFWKSVMRYVGLKDLHNLALVSQEMYFLARSHEIEGSYHKKDEDRVTHLLEEYHFQEEMTDDPEEMVDQLLEDLDQDEAEMNFDILSQEVDHLLSDEDEDLGKMRGLDVEDNWVSDENVDGDDNNSESGVKDEDDDDKTQEKENCINEVVTSDVVPSIMKLVKLMA